MIKDIIEKIDDWAIEYIPGPIYRIPIRIHDFYWYGVVSFFQKVFRKSHTSDKEIWNLSHYLAPIIYRKLQAFYDTERVGYPAAFSDYSEYEWKSKEEYEEKRKSEEIVGGGEDKWNEYLKEMLFAFEFFSLDDTFSKKQQKFFDKWGLVNPYRKTEDNKRISNLFGTEVILYHDLELEIEYYKRAQRGFELFGKYFMNLWD